MMLGVMEILRYRIAFSREDYQHSFRVFGKQLDRFLCFTFGLVSVRPASSVYDVISDLLAISTVL